MKIIELRLTEERMRAFRDAIKKCADIDSLDEIELLMDAEHIFGVEIPDYGSNEWIED